MLKVLQDGRVIGSVASGETVTVSAPVTGDYGLQVEQEGAGVAPFSATFRIR